MLDSEGKMDQSPQDVKEQEPPPILYCRRCGARLEAEAKFCSACGLPITEDVLSGQELKQLSDSAKAAARAGMTSARKNLAKGMESAGEKISSAAERLRQEKQPGDISGSEIKKRSWKIPAGIAAAVLLVILLVNLLGRNPVRDIKDVVFDQYGSQTLGEAVETSIPDASWDAEKLDSKHYKVTLSGFCPELGSRIRVLFDVNYSGEYVYARPMHVSVNEELFDDAFATVFVMEAIYE